MSVNKAILIGRLGIDPEVKEFEDGGKVVNFRMATNRVFKDQDGNKAEATEWHNVVFRSKLADIAEKYLHKGSNIYLEGYIRTRKYTDKNGEDRYITEIVGFEMRMLDSRNDNGNSTDGDSNQQSNASETNNTKKSPDVDDDFDDEDDIPF